MQTGKIRAAKGRSYRERTGDRGYEMYVWVGNNLIIAMSAGAHDAINGATSDRNDGSITQKAYERRVWMAVGGKGGCERL